MHEEGDDRAYPYLSVPSRSAKPRRSGRTLIQDKGVSLAALEDTFRTTAAFIDYYKPSSLYHAIFPEAFLRRKLELAREHGARTVMGGNVLELAIAQHAVDAHLAYTRQLAFDVVEISETYLTIPEARKHELIERCRSQGLEVFLEWGRKRPGSPLEPDVAAGRLRDYLESGVSVAVLEEGEVDLLIGADGRGPYGSRLVTLFERVGVDRLMVETTRPAQIAWFLREIGNDVSFGNVVPGSVAELEALRRGIGRAVDYAIYAPWVDPASS